VDQLPAGRDEMATPGRHILAGEPFVEEITPRGRGAIAVVEVWGSEAAEVVDRVFRPRFGPLLAGAEPGRLRLGHIGHDPGDEVVAVKRPGPTPVVEIQCHGGSAAVAAVVECLVEAGASRGRSRTTTPVGSSDPLAVQALEDLSRAPTLCAAEILLDQAGGALRRAIIGLCRAIEGRPTTALSRLETLIARAKVGLRLLTGWRVSIAGRPNAGKSRLFNALAGFPRAIVDPTPGVTRDVVTFRMALAGWPVEIADTAGLRETADGVECLGILKAIRERQHADLVLLALDLSEPLLPADRDLIASMPGALLVANKSDLPPAWGVQSESLHSFPIVTVSAERGDGIPALIEAIVNRLVPEPPGPGDAVPFRAVQVDQLKEARFHLGAGDSAGAKAALTPMIQGGYSRDQGL
jgi:tRNA modification GTPase